MALLTRQLIINPTEYMSRADFGSSNKNNNNTVESLKQAGGTAAVVAVAGPTITQKSSNSSPKQAPTPKPRFALQTDTMVTENEKLPLPPPSPIAPPKPPPHMTERAVNTDDEDLSMEDYPIPQFRSAQSTSIIPGTSNQTSTATMQHQHENNRLPTTFSSLSSEDFVVTHL